MKLTSRETYKVVRGILRLKKFTQYQVSKEEKVNFNIVNRTVNWLITQKYVVKRTGFYEVVNPTGILSLMRMHRTLKPVIQFNLELTQEEFLDYIKGKGKLCLTTALSYYDNYFRDPTLHVYLDDKELLHELKGTREGLLQINIYKEDLNSDDFVKIKGHWISSKIRTLIDLYCSNKAYATEQLIRKELL